MSARRPWLWIVVPAAVLCAALILLVGVLWLFGVLFWIGALHNPKRGTAPNVEGVPEVGPAIASLETRGPVHYGYWHARRTPSSPRTTSCIISGTTSVAAIQAFCRSHGLEFREHDDDPIDLSAYVDAVRGDPAQFPTDFSDRDASASGRISGLGFVRLRYRYEDARFVLIVEVSKRQGP